MALQITSRISIPDDEIVVSQVRAPGPGGQNVNKVASAIHLRFSIQSSSLPPEVKSRLLARQDHRVTAGGEIVIKASRHRSRELNLEDARQRLAEMIIEASQTQKKRRPTKPSKSSRKRRLDAKSKHGKTKQLRKKIIHD